jgi:lysozyme
MIASEIVRQVAQDEGFRSTVYKDSLGYDTIGYGFLVDSRKSGGLTEEECELILKMRLEKLAFQVLPQRIPWMLKLPLPYQGILVNMAYNLGVTGLLGFKKMLASLKAGNSDEAAQHMLDSKWAKQVGDRAKRLAEQMRSGEWQ